MSGKVKTRVFLVFLILIAGALSIPAVALAQGETPTTPEQNTPVPFVPYPTSTPNEEGMIIHVVGEGQTLWSIAQSYGVTVDEIRGLNAMPTESADIYPGQQLLIRMGVTVTPAQLDTTPAGTPQPQIETDIPVAITPEPTKTVMPSPSITALPVPSSTETPAGINLQNLPRGADLAGWIILTVGAIGLVLVILFGFRRSPK